jgi:hypothetical protein
MKPIPNSHSVLHYLALTAQYRFDITGNAPRYIIIFMKYKKGPALRISEAVLQQNQKNPPFT